MLRNSFCLVLLCFFFSSTGHASQQFQLVTNWPDTLEGRLKVAIIIKSQSKGHITTSIAVKETAKLKIEKTKNGYLILITDDKIVEHKNLNGRVDKAYIMAEIDSYPTISLDKDGKFVGLVDFNKYRHLLKSRLTKFYRPGSLIGALTIRLRIGGDKFEKDMIRYYRNWWFNLYGRWLNRKLEIGKVYPGTNNITLEKSSPELPTFVATSVTKLKSHGATYFLLTRNEWLQDDEQENSRAGQRFFCKRKTTLNERNIPIRFQSMKESELNGEKTQVFEDYELEIKGSGFKTKRSPG